MTRRAGSPPGGPRAGGVLPVLLLVVLLWGGSYPAIKATQAFFPPVGLAAFRTAAAAGILAGVGLLRGGLRLALPRADWVRLAAAGVAGNTAFHLLLVTGVHRTTAAHAAILVNLSPIVAALLARTVNREPLGGRRAAGLAMALAGVAVVVGGRDGAGAAAGRLGDLLCLGASVAWALFTALGKPVLARGSPRLVTTWATLLGAVPLLPLGAAEIAAVRWSALGPGEWLLLGYLSAGTIAAGNLLWYWALERAATARVVSFTYLIPLVGAGLAVALGQERPSLALVAGGLATVAGVALAQGAGRAGEAA